MDSGCCGANLGEIQSLISFLPSDDMLNILTSPITDIVICKTMKSFPSNKAPGPDGYSAEFFKNTWGVTEDIVTKAIQDFFITGKLLKPVNATWITLVPEVPNPSSMTKFRPISCCNVIYKCITKLLANKLQSWLPYCISNNQTAFVSGRRIGDNILLAQEVIQNYHTKGLSSRCTVKIDITKAFDSVSRTFLENVL